jgi:hypothetical protein
MRRRYTGGEERPGSVVMRAVGARRVDRGMALLRGTRARCGGDAPAHVLFSVAAIEQNECWMRRSFRVIWRPSGARGEASGSLGRRRAVAAREATDRASTRSGHAVMPASGSSRACGGNRPRRWLRLVGVAPLCGSFAHRGPRGHVVLGHRSFERLYNTRLHLSAPRALIHAARRERVRSWAWSGSAHRVAVGSYGVVHHGLGGRAAPQVSRRR